jgi:L-rhamnose mutarotase
MRVAIHTRLREDGVEGYEAAHRDIPAEIVDLLHEGGATGWTIWRNGLDLFHLVECEDFDALIVFVSKHDADKAWQARVGEFRDFSLLGGDQPLPVIFEL